MNELRDEVTRFLHHHGLRLNTDLGQHFLVDETALALIVEAAGITEEDRIVEIGPGIGVLTRELARRAGKVSAVELDERMLPLLKSFLSGEGKELLTKVTVTRGNALHTPLPADPYKIVANIPYHITSPLLRHVFLESQAPPTTMTLLIQKEVAETICDGRNAGILTILVGLFGTPRYVGTVGREAFLPPPKVDSAILHVECFARPLAEPAVVEKIFTLTKTGFGQKRKMLRNTLGKLPEGMEKLKGIGIDPERRPQTLTVGEWIRLAEVM
ncbi:MAG: 16S rRNA (adenine(1518)-N(6)/adenine(1519)-N(6))-dimethyltransferase RsmA [Candidatus Peribacteraceae bacterium]|jgi:16S rRNA (adenine1518-N6/adenine1519-N6)-dimethyltransferase